MIKYEQIHAVINKENTFYILDMQYMDTSFNVRLNTLSADDLIEHVATSIHSFIYLQHSDKIELAREFLRQLFKECEKYAEKTLAHIPGTNIFKMVPLNYEYALILDDQYVVNQLEEHFDIS